MAIKFPRHDLPLRVLGGSDVWDTADAGALLLADYFEESASEIPLALRQSYIANAKTISSIAVQAGDLVVVGLYQDGVQVATSCADSGGNTYRKGAEQHITDGAGCGIYLYYTRAGATESLTITGTMAGAGYNSIFVHVYSGSFGADPLHAYQTKGETVRSTSHTGAEITTTTPNAILFCLWGEPSGSGTISENGSGFTERQEDAGTASYDRIVSAAGTYSNAVTSTVSTALASILAAFIGVSGGGGGVNGTGSGTQALQSGGGTGTVTLAGTGASSQRVQACAGAGTQSVSGTGAATQRTQSAAGTGSATYTAAGAGTQRTQVGSGVGSATYSGSGASTQILQSGSGTGTNTAPGVNGTGSGTQALQSGGGTGTAAFAGIGAGVQRVQSSAGTGTQTLGGSGGGVQVRQVGTGQGSASLAGTGAGLQAIQIGTGQGVLTLNGSGAGVQILQSCDGVGTVATFQPSTLDLGFFLALPPITNTFTLPPIDALVVLPAINQTITLPPVDSTLTLPALKNEVIA